MAWFIEVLRETVRYALIGHNDGKRVWKVVTMILATLGLGALEAAVTKGKVRMPPYFEEFDFGYVIGVAGFVVIVAASFVLAWNSVAAMKFDRFKLVKKYGSLGIVVRNSSCTTHVENPSVAVRADTIDVNHSEATFIPLCQDVDSFVKNGERLEPKRPQIPARGGTAYYRLITFIGDWEIRRVHASICPGCVRGYDYTL